jgi:hypothetical protein
MNDAVSQLLIASKKARFEMECDHLSQFDEAYDTCDCHLSEAIRDLDVAIYRVEQSIMESP